MENDQPSHGNYVTLSRLLMKVRESALSAVAHYNNPLTVFKSGTYVVLIIISWTSLFQAVFQKRNIDYFVKDVNGNYVFVDGEKKAWDISRLISEFYSNPNDLIRKNLEFLVKLRNKFEHRSFPEIDDNIFGECQAALLNLEELRLSEFPTEQPIVNGLAFSMQFTKDVERTQLRGFTEDIAGELASLRTYLREYRNNISFEGQDPQKFSFQLFLIPKVGNNRTSDSIPVEFVKFSRSSNEDMELYKGLTVLIKDRVVNGPVIEKEKIIKEEVQIPNYVNINTDVIVDIFTSLEEINSETAIRILRQLPYEMSGYLPVFFAIRKSGMTIDEITALIDSATSTTSAARILLRRLSEGDKDFFSMNCDMELREEIVNERVKTEEVGTDNIRKVLQALRNFKKDELKAHLNYVMTILSNSYKKCYLSSSTIRSEIRNALCYVDQQIYSVS